MIDLRSDTVTKPSPEMKEAMFTAEVGDDVFGEDLAINALQARVAGHFGHEAGIFCPSGTMTNQVAIRVHTQPGDEVICADVAHVYLYEGGGIARNSMASVRLLKGDRGRLSVSEVEGAIQPDDSHLSRTSLVCLEDTVNKGGGCYYDIEDIRAIRKLCDERGLKLHLDGARVFNALAESGYDAAEYGSLFHSISICFSKGLGCPVGSVLVGDQQFIAESHRVRKGFGGGMRQAGYLAQACDYALDHNIDRLKEDHARARKLGEIMTKHTDVQSVTPVETNIVIFELREGLTSADFEKKMEEAGVLAVAFGPTKVRLVTHLDFDDAKLEAFEVAIEKVRA
jgi:threonine aldolase